MITEDYVSFEIAKLLKEKGFDEICRNFYKCWPTNPKLYCCDRSQMFDYCTNSSLSTFNYDGDEINIATPTLQMAMKWLREVHNLWCEISPEGKGLWYTEIYSLINEEYIPNSNSHKNKSYKEAIEVAIKYCLKNLI